jgi:alpha/beta superfamily hydrolase
LKSKKLKIIKFTSIGVGILLVVYLGLSVYGAREGIEIPRLPLTYKPASLELPYEDASFQSRGDGVLLKGWYLPGDKNSVILIVHGGFQNRIDDNVDTLGLTRALVKTGYSVLLFDMRGRGESEGRGLALSNIEPDIGGAVDYLKSRGYRAGDICILGFCSGAASACIFASQNSLGALILDGCFIDVPTEVARQAESIGIPQFLEGLFMPGGLFFSRVLYDYKLVNPIDVVHNIACPILFIHEENDEFIRYEETLKLLRSSDSPANEVWEVSDTQHSQSFRTHPKEFIERVDEFINRASMFLPTGDIAGDDEVSAD